MSTKLTTSEEHILIALVLVILVCLVKRKSEARTTTVPRSAEYLFYLLHDKATRTAMAGDLEEEFHTIYVPKFGQRLACLWYWKQVLCSLPPGCWTLLRRLTVLGTVVEAVHRLLTWR